MATSHVVTKRLLIDWALSGSYTDESTRLIRAEGSVRYSAPGGSFTQPRNTVDRMTLTLENKDYRFNPFNPSSPVFQNQGYHAPCTLDVALNGGAWTRIFTGVVKTPQYIVASADESEPGQISLDVRSRDELLLSHRQSTLWSDMAGLKSVRATERGTIILWLERAGYVNGSDFTSASMDPGQFARPWAWQDDESTLEECWELAASAGGVFYADVDGLFRYENLTHWLRQELTTPTEVLTADGYRRVQPRFLDNDLASEVVTEASPRAAGEPGVLWEPEEPVSLGAGESRTLIARLRQPAAQYLGVSITAASAGGWNLTAAIQSSVTYYAQRAEITLTNTDTALAAEVVVALTGIPLVGRPSIERRAESSLSFWQKGKFRPGRVKSIRGNPYVQTALQLAVMTPYLRDRLETPQLTWAAQNLLGNPARRLGDYVWVNEGQIAPQREALLTAIGFRLDKGGFWQDVEAVDITDWPHHNFFVLATSQVSGPDQLFY